MERLLAPMLLMVLAALVAAGCGGSERLSYERDLAKVGRTVDRSLEELPDSDGETIGADDVAKLADDLRDAAGQLHDLDAPAGVAGAQKRLERGLRGIAASFDDLASELRRAKTDAAKAELFVEFATDEQVDAAFDDVIAAQERYAAKGYRVFGTERAAPAAATAAPTAGAATTEP
ncbi:MAG: hypothetical protein JWM86_2097 [Thermoleophilia bacterium]|nr:hypothetical protein [Thermoleophilia bacterium]